MPEHKTLSAPYEPLKPPEIRRDDITGRFERKGLLAKAAKFRPDQPAKRRPGGRPFQPGVSGNPAGKKKGTPNKITVALREAILQAGELAGGKEGLVGYLTMLARDNSSAYAGLLAKILPTQLAADAESNGGASAQITFTRVIVHADGRREVEGATPKQLPPRTDASHAPTDPTDDTNEGAVG